MLTKDLLPSPAQWLSNLKKGQWFGEKPLKLVQVDRYVSENSLGVCSVLKPFQWFFKFVQSPTFDLRVKSHYF